MGREEGFTWGGGSTAGCTVAPPPASTPPPLLAPASWAPEPATAATEPLTPLPPPGVAPAEKPVELHLLAPAPPRLEKSRPPVTLVSTAPCAGVCAAGPDVPAGGACAGGAAGAVGAPPTVVMPAKSPLAAAVLASDVGGRPGTYTHTHTHTDRHDMLAVFRSHPLGGSGVD